MNSIVGLGISFHSVRTTKLIGSTAMSDGRDSLGRAFQRDGYAFPFRVMSEAEAAEIRRRLERVESRCAASRTR